MRIISFPLQATGNQSRATCHGPAGVSGEDLRSLEAGAMSCGMSGLMAAPHSLLAAACVLAGLLTAGLIVTAVHCQKKMFRGWLWPKSGSCSSLQCCRVGSGHRGYSCDKYRHQGQTSPGASGGGDSELSVTMEASLYYSDRTMGPYSLQPRPVSQAGVSNCQGFLWDKETDSGTVSSVLIKMISSIRNL